MGVMLITGIPQSKLVSDLLVVALAVAQEPCVWRNCQPDGECKASIALDRCSSSGPTPARFSTVWRCDNPGDRTLTEQRYFGANCSGVPLTTTYKSNHSYYEEASPQGAYFSATCTRYTL
jgi:hypothetical protein